MTDEEALKALVHLRCFADHDGTMEHVAAVDHALQALADRQALVAAIARLYECKSEVAGEPAIWWADNETQRVTGAAYDAARRHMEGK